MGGTFGEPAPANYTPPNGLTTLNDMMSLKSKKQSIDAQALQMQGQQSTNQSLAATASIDTRTAGEQSKLAQIPWDSFEKDDGSYDVDSARKMALKVAPTTGADFAERLNKTTQGAAETKKAFSSLNDQQQQGIRSALGSWGADPKAPLSDLLTQAEAAKANAPDATRAQLSKVVDHAVQAITGPDLITGQPKTVQQQKANAVGFSRAGLSNAEVSGSGGLATPLAGVQGLGSTAQPIVTNRVTGETQPIGNPMKVTIPPGYMQGPNGSIIRADNAGLSAPPVRDQGSGAAGPTTGTKLQPIQRPGLNAPAPDQQRYAASMEAGRQHYSDVSAAANDLQNGVGPTRYRNDQIQDILNSKTFSPTGPGAAELNWISSKIPGESGDAFQKIGHYLAQNSAAIAQKMGVPGTNMGSEQAAAASGSTSQNKGALLEITKVNDAMNTALDMYNRGLAKVSGNGADPSKVSAYRQAFGQNFDMNVLRYDDALRRKDKAEIDKIKQEAGPNGLKAMGAKRKVLHSLADTGELP